MAKKCFGTGAIFLALLIAGCSTVVESGNDGKEVPLKQDPVELVLYYPFAGDWNEESFMKNFGEPIQRKFPHITIKYMTNGEGTSLNELLTAGEPIDIIMVSIGRTSDHLTELELQEDLTPLAQKHQFDLDSLDPAMIEMQRQMSGGAVYGLPVYVPPSTVYYNKGIFDKFGVEYPKDGMTWDEFYELARKVTGSIDGQDYIGFSPSQNHMVLMNPFSLPLIDPATGRSTYGDAKWKTILETELLRFAKDPVYKSAMEKYRKGKLPDTNTFLKDRVVAMYPGGPLTPIVLANEMNAFNWDLVAAPTYEDRQGTGFQSYPNYISITNKSEHKDEAMEVIKFLISDEYQTKLSRSGNMTVLQNEQIQKQMGEDGAFKGKNYSAYFYNKLAPIAQGANVQTEKDPLYSITNRLVPIINGELDINTALRQAEEEVNTGIKAVSGR